MRVERIQTKQVHPVPNKITSPQGPFPPEILSQPRVIHDYPRQGDDGNLEGGIEGTAQNNFQPVKWYTCNACSMMVSEDQLETHLCED